MCPAVCPDAFPRFSSAPKLPPHAKASHHHLRCISQPLPTLTFTFMSRFLHLFLIRFDEKIVKTRKVRHDSARKVGWEKSKRKGESNLKFQCSCNFPNAIYLLMLEFITCIARKGNISATRQQTIQF